MLQRSLKVTKKYFAGKVVLIALSAILIGTPVSAGFNPAYIVSDFDFFNYTSMSLTTINNFLHSKGGAIASMTFSTGTETKTAAEIIYQAAREYQISPRVILVTLQKEQSLITNPSPSQSALNFAMGYGCPDSGGCSANASGFYKQIDFATWQLRRYTDFPNNYTYRIGNTYTFSDLSGTKSTTVKIQNQASANLYNYTPHVYNGNYNFYNLFNNWFKSLYPDGTLLKADNDHIIWIIKNGKKLRFRNKLAFDSRGYSLTNLIVVPAAEIDKYTLGGSIDFPNHSLVIDEDSNRYMLDGLQKRPISKAVFDEIGFYEEELLGPAQGVNKKSLTTFDTGTSIIITKNKPLGVQANAAGVLVQDKTTGAIGFVQDGIMHMLHSKEVLRSQFPNTSWIQISHTDFTSFKIGSPVKMRDGSLVMSPKYGGKIFVISGGKKLHIKTPETFFGLGYKLQNIIRTTDRVLDIHPTGPSVTG